jgi:tRNA(Arg) A34 adenosine deaminase TadA
MSLTQEALETYALDRRPFILGDQSSLARLWNSPLGQLVTLGPYDGSKGEFERHRIYSLALMKLVKEYWNGNKKGAVGEYLDRKYQLWADVSKQGNFIYRCSKADDPRAVGTRVRDYMGHNIAALAVDGDGDIIDFEFNHNEIFCSSVEHAESRLVRRIFSLALLDEGWHLAGAAPTSKPATNLSNVTIYTSLEPCAQCAGIMMLAGIKAIVYLQRDFGTSSIGNIIYNLTHTTQIPAPRPIPASDFGFDYFNELTNGFRAFSEQVVDTPFWKHPSDPNGNDNVASVTSFLCTDTAYEIYEKAAKEFDKYELKEPDYPSTERPPDSSLEATSEASRRAFKLKSNREVLASAQTFVKEAVRIGRRGTPHRV